MDFEIVRYCNRLGRGALDPFCLWICDLRVLAALWLSLIALGVYLDRPRARDFVRTMALAFVLHFIVTEGLLKHALAWVIPLRVRPYLAHPGEVVPVGFRFHDASFPSSHNATSALFFMVFALFHPRSLPLGAAFVLLMAFARMHNGMHYPTDVLTGITLGIGYALLARALVHPPGRPSKLRPPP